LKEEFKGKLNLEKLLRQFSRHVDIPIKINKNGEFLLIKNQGFMPDKEPFEQKSNKEISFHSIPIKDDEVDGILSLCGILEHGLFWKPLPEDSIYVKFDSSKRFFISYEGIFVNHANILPKWISPNNIFCDLNIKQNAIELDASRDRIVPNNKFESLQIKIEEILIREFENLFEKYRKSFPNKMAGAMIHAFFENYVKRFFELTRDDDHETVEIPEKLMKFFKRNYPLWEISKDGIKYVICEELNKRGKKIVCIHGINSSDERFVKEIFQKIKGLTDENIYIVYSWGLSYLGEDFFGEYKEKHYADFLEIEKSKELIGILPKTWRVGRIKDYKTTKFIEISETYGRTIVNRDNRFLDLIIRGASNLTGEQKLALTGFFRILKETVKRDFSEFVSNQEKIIRIFVNMKIIEESEIPKYILTEEDFPDRDYD